MNPVEQRQAKQQQFLNETLLLDGKHQSSSTHQSIIFYSTQKCGSLYTLSILCRIIEDLGMTSINLDRYLWVTGMSVEEINFQAQLNRAFKTRGYFYGCFRQFNLWSIENLDDYKILLLLRDPRDVLTSLYFYMAFRNEISRENPKKRKETLIYKITALRRSIDDYVLESMPRYVEIYQDYLTHLWGKPNVLCVTYEHMVSNFDVWLDTILNGLDLDVSPSLINQIKSEANFTVDREDIHSHKRQVQPGDHKRKLKPETIEILNDRFAEILETLGYDRD